MTTHCFRKLILTLMSQTQMKVCISTKTTLTKITIIQIIFFILINICNIPKNLKKFELFLSNLKHEFQIICCSESRLKDSTKDRYTPKGFTHVFDYRGGGGKRGGGTLIFIKDSVQYEERKDLKLDLHSDLTNSCFIELDKHTINNRRNIVLGCIYINHLMYKFNEKNNDICFSLSNTNTDVYLLGDFNNNLSDSCSNNHNTQEFKNILFYNSFIPLIHKPTCINNNYATIIVIYSQMSPLSKWLRLEYWPQNLTQTTFQFLPF